MSRLLNLGDAISASAHRFPDKVGARDLSRSLSYRQWNERARRLSNALLGLGLSRGDRVAILAYNCVEWLEMYAATAKASLVAVPVNFRLVATEIRHILQDAGARAVVVQDELVERIEELLPDLSRPPPALIQFGRRRPPRGFHSYEDLLAAGAAEEPGGDALAADPWTMMYTSGTTGRPKGAVQTHQSAATIALVTDLDFGFTAGDTPLLVMPMCHANSLYFFAAFAYCGATCTVYDRRSVDPEELLRTLSEEHITFTSLVPTHYITMLDLPPAVRRRHRARDVPSDPTSSSPGSARSAGSSPGRRRSGCSTRAAPTYVRARSVSSTRGPRTRSPAIGTSPRRPPRLSVASTVRSATWHAATRTASITSWIASGT